MWSDHVQMSVQTFWNLFSCMFCVYCDVWNPILSVGSVRKLSYYLGLDPLPRGNLTFLNGEETAAALMLQI